MLIYRETKLTKRNYASKNVQKFGMLMPFRIDDKKLLETYKAVWTKIKDLKNIELNALPAYDIDI